MLAVVEIGGKQYTVTPKMQLVVDRQHLSVGETFDIVPLMVADVDGKNVEIGTPRVEGAKVTCHIDEHQKGAKVRVFKMKSKKRYMRTMGFRPFETVITVKDIVPSAK